jgi:hypothetical protein
VFEKLGNVINADHLGFLYSLYAMTIIDMALTPNLFEMGRTIEALKNCLERLGDVGLLSASDQDPDLDFCFFEVEVLEKLKNVSGV